MTCSLLLVEDESELLEIFTRRFERRGYQVVGCASVDRLLDIAAEQPIDVAVMDRTLRGRDAVSLISGLRAIHSHVKVIVLSGRADQGSIDQARAAGANEYLAKPCSFADLEAAVQRAYQVMAS